MSGIQVQPLLPWRSTLPWVCPSFGFNGQSTTVAWSVMLAGPALSAFSIFHSSECADVVKVPGGNGALAVDRSSAQAIDEVATRPIAIYRPLLVITASVVLCVAECVTDWSKDPQWRPRRTVSRAPCQHAGNTVPFTPAASTRGHRPASCANACQLRQRSRWRWRERSPMSRSRPCHPAAPRF